MKPENICEAATLAALELAEQALSTLPPGTATLRTANSLLEVRRAIARLQEASLPSPLP